MDSKLSCIGIFKILAAPQSSLVWGPDHIYENMVWSQATSSQIPRLCRKYLVHVRKSQMRMCARPQIPDVHVCTSANRRCVRHDSRDLPGHRTDPSRHSSGWITSPLYALRSFNFKGLEKCLGKSGARRIYILFIADRPHNFIHYCYWLWPTVLVHGFRTNVGIAVLSFAAKAWDT